jgi:hypothetical protein
MNTQTKTPTSHILGATGLSKRPPAALPLSAVRTGNFAPEANQ